MRNSRTANAAESVCSQLQRKILIALAKNSPRMISDLYRLTFILGGGGGVSFFGEKGKKRVTKPNLTSALRRKMTKFTQFQCSSDWQWLSLSSFRGRSSSSSSSNASLFQAIGGVVSLALCPQVVSQAPQPVSYTHLTLPTMAVV